MMETIIKSFDTWTAAQTIKSNGRNISVANQRLLGVDKLRELILELSVRGKLVPQDEKEEPACKLIDRIILENKKNIKKEKVLKERIQNKTNESFEMPKGWELVSISLIGNIFNGNSINEKIKEEKYSKENGGYPFIATKDVGYGWAEINYNNGIHIPINENGFKVAHKNAVLICSEGGSAGKKCGITNRDICFGNKLYAIELLGNISSKYILSNYLSPSFFVQFKQKMTGIIGGISIQKFCEILISLPPLAEQQRIVAKVDELMALCDQLEQQQTQSNAAHQQLVELLLQNLTEAGSSAAFEAAWQHISLNFDTLFTTEYSIDHLKQTVLQLAVMGKLVPQDPKDEPASELLKKIRKEKDQLIYSKKFQNTGQIKPFDLDCELPQNWIGVRIGELCPSIVPNRDKPKTFSGNIPWITLPDFPQDKWFLNIEQKRTGLTQNEVEEYSARVIPPGSVLMSCVGRFGLTAINLEPVVVNQQIHAFVMLKGLSPEFLSIVIKVNSNSLEDNANSTTIKYLNKTKCESIQFGLPPLLEQHRIVAKVDELFALCDALKARIKEAQETQGVLAECVVEGVLG